MIVPRRIKFKKVHRNKFSFKKMRRISICKSQFGLKSLTSSFLSERQIGMILKLLNKNLKKNSKVFLRVFCFMPVTKKPLETRMGKGKGNFNFWNSPIKAGQTLIEIQNVNIDILKDIEFSLSKKLALQLKIVYFSIN